MFGSSWKDKDSFEEFLESEIKDAEYSNWRATSRIEHILDEYRKQKKDNTKVIEHFKEE